MQFVGIRSEGGLLPPDILEQIAPLVVIEQRRLIGVGLIQIETPVVIEICHADAPPVLVVIHARCARTPIPRPLSTVRKSWRRTRSATAST